jgi:hypothetical protein
VFVGEDFKERKKGVVATEGWGVLGGGEREKGKFIVCVREMKLFCMVQFNLLDCCMAVFS